MYFKRELCVTPATLYTCFKQISLNISNVYLQTQSGFNVTWGTTDIKPVEWTVQKYLQILLWLNVKNTSSFESLLSFW